MPIKLDTILNDSCMPILAKQTIYIGTSGYSFEDWREVFYPVKLTKRRYLEYYIQHFPTVEINATYYRMLSESSFRNMANNSPEYFKFWVKLPGSVTHKRSDPRQDLDNFHHAIRPLIDANKFAGALAQFPVSFKLSDHSVQYLENLAFLNDKIPLAFEFRHSDWINKDTIEMIRGLGISLVTPDLPRVQGLPKYDDINVTNNIAYVRLHGRNDVNWYNPQLGDRYDYDYSDAELSEWADKITNLGMQDKVDLIFIFFNNCHMGSAVKNAKKMQNILQTQIAKLV